MRLLRLYRETGSHEARPLNNGRKPRLSPETLEIIRERIKRQPDVTLRELIEEYSLPLSEAALCKIIKYKLGFVRKKNGLRGGTRQGRYPSTAQTMERSPGDP